jgi:hypothetical protein
MYDRRQPEDLVQPSLSSYTFIGGERKGMSCHDDDGGIADRIFSNDTYIHICSVWGFYCHVYNNNGIDMIFMAYKTYKHFLPNILSFDVSLFIRSWNCLPGIAVVVFPFPSFFL